MQDEKINQAKEALIRWNNAYPLDRPFRKKYGMAYNSEAHRKTNQIDIFMEWVEDKLYEDLESDLIEREREEVNYKKGKWLKDRADKISSAEELELFDKLQF